MDPMLDDFFVASKLYLTARDTLIDIHSQISWSKTNFFSRVSITNLVNLEKLNLDFYDFGFEKSNRIY